MFIARGLQLIPWVCVVWWRQRVVVFPSGLFPFSLWLRTCWLSGSLGCSTSRLAAVVRTATLLLRDLVTGSLPSWVSRLSELLRLRLRMRLVFAICLYFYIKSGIGTSLEWKILIVCGMEFWTFWRIFFLSIGEKTSLRVLEICSVAGDSAVMTTVAGGGLHVLTVGGVGARTTVGLVRFLFMDRALALERFLMSL